MAVGDFSAVFVHRHRLCHPLSHPVYAQHHLPQRRGHPRSLHRVDPQAFLPEQHQAGLRRDGVSQGAGQHGGDQHGGGPAPGGGHLGGGLRLRPVRFPLQADPVRRCDTDHHRAGADLSVPPVHDVPVFPATGTVRHTGRHRSGERHLQAGGFPLALLAAVSVRHGVPLGAVHLHLPAVLPGNAG